MKLSEAPTIHPTASVTDCTLGRWTEVARDCRLRASTLGDYSYCMDRTQIDFAAIGKFANIASDCWIGATNHPFERATQHHFTYRSDDYFEGEPPDEAFFGRRAAAGPRIGHDVWIGTRAVVLPGVTVHDGAIVASGAVVSRDVGPYEIHGGVPARRLGRRFEPAIAERMAALAWWDWEHDALRAALRDFRALSAEAFLEAYEGPPREAAA